MIIGSMRDQRITTAAQANDNHKQMIVANKTRALSEICTRKQDLDRSEKKLETMANHNCRTNDKQITIAERKVNDNCKAKDTRITIAERKVNRHIKRITIARVKGNHNRKTKNKQITIVKNERQAN